MKILALDLGTNCGWAISDRKGNLSNSGVRVFGVKRGESPGFRYIRFNHWLNNDVLEARINAVIYEQPHHRGGAATEIAAGFSTRVQEFAAGNDIEHSHVHSATLKKWTTGSGRAGKEEVIKIVNERWKEGVTDDNEADAIALLFYCLEKYK